MIPDDTIASPSAFLEHMVGELSLRQELLDWEHHWRALGSDVSASIDRAGTPHVRMFDALGRRIDEIVYPPDYWQLLGEGYRRGHVWRAFDQGSPMPFLLMGYVTSFFDPGLFCPYTVSMATAVAVDKYGDGQLKSHVLPALLRRDAKVWQGATWMTEAGGGSDLGAAVHTVARKDASGPWRLSGDKHFCSNAAADVAVVAARPDGAPAGVRGLALFLVPRLRQDGTLNVTLRRLKDKIATRSVPTGEIELRDSEAWLLGSTDIGVYLVLEVLNLSRVANAFGAAALVQRALAEAAAFGRARVAFGRPIAEHPLLAAELDSHATVLRRAFALAWEAGRRLEEVWQERPRYSQRHHDFRLVAHLAKYWTADCAVEAARWAVEVFAGAGTLAENRVERWLRESMILAIWEGTPHRQMLDGLEVAVRHAAHESLLDDLADVAAARDVEAWRHRWADHLALAPDAREARIAPIFRDFAEFVADAALARLEVANAGA
jgi:acyl-CoA dehydrogenase